MKRLAVGSVAENADSLASSFQDAPRSNWSFADAQQQGTHLFQLGVVFRLQCESPRCPESLQNKHHIQPCIAPTEALQAPAEVVDICGCPGANQ